MRTFGFAVLVAIIFFGIGRWFSPREQFDEQAAINLSLPVNSGESTLGPDAIESKKSGSVIVSNPTPEDREVDLRVGIESARGENLFAIVFSAGFQKNWTALKPFIETRLSSPLPSLRDREIYDQEVISRLGLLKALAVEQSSPMTSEIKDVLVTYLENFHEQPWVLQREAMHSLLVNPAVSVDETERLTRQVDVRTRATASLTDQQIADEVLRSAR